VTAESGQTAGMTGISGIVGLGMAAININGAVNMFFLIGKDASNGSYTSNQV